MRLSCSLPCPASLKNKRTGRRIFSFFLRKIAVLRCFSASRKHSTKRAREKRFVDSTARDTSRHNYSSEYLLRSVDTPTELNIERGKVGGNATPHCAGPAVGEQPAAPFPARLFLVGWLGKRGATHLLPKLFCPRAREKFSPPYYCSVARENLVIRSFHCVSPPPPLGARTKIGDDEFRPSRDSGKSPGKVGGDRLNEADHRLGRGMGEFGGRVNG